MQIETIAKTGINFNLKHFNEIVRNSPELSSFAPELWKKSFDNLLSEGFDENKFLWMIESNPKLLYKDPTNLHQQLEDWRSFQFGSKITLELLETHPQLIGIKDIKELNRNIEIIKQFVQTHKNVAKILINSPTAICDSPKLIQDKIKYFENDMQVEFTEVVKSSAFSLDLQTIKTRHVFLERLGLYEKKTKKTKDLESKNPKIYQITDTSDKRFATKVCFVTLDEYETFVELFKKETAKKLDDEEDLDSLVEDVV